MDYVQPLGGAAGAPYVDANPALAIEGSAVPAAAIEHPQREIMAVIAGVGMAGSGSDLTQLKQAIERMIDAQSGNYALDTGVANAYVVALNPAIAAYSDGMTVRVKIVNANSGASTLNAGGGVVPLVNDVGGALVAGDLPAGGIVTATYIASAASFYVTSLVQSQTRSLSSGGTVLVNTTSTLTATAHAGKSVLCGDAAPITLTLPLISTMRDGSRIELYNTSSAAVTIARQGTDVIGGSSGATSIVLQPNEFVTLSAGSAYGQWFTVSSSFGSSLAASGYQKLPSGLIIQWGIITATTTPTNFSFPIAFPTACQSISIGSSSAAIPIGIAPVSATQFSATAASSTSGGRWIAFGY